MKVVPLNSNALHLLEKLAICSAAKLNLQPASSESSCLNEQANSACFFDLSERLKTKDIAEVIVIKGALTPAPF